MGGLTIFLHAALQRRVGGHDLVTASERNPVQHARMETLSNEKTLERAMQFHVIAHVAALMALHDNDRRLRGAAIRLRKRANVLAENGLRPQPATEP